MHFAVNMGFLGLAVLTMPHAFAREPLVLEETDPESRTIDDILSPLQDGGEVQDYLSGAQCGGWDKNTGAGDFISDITNLPGRPHDWDGDILSGMGVRSDEDDDGDRDDEFQFPSSTRGFSTVCNEKQDRTEKLVWRETNNPDFPGEITQERVNLAYPYFEDPPCQWRIEGQNTPPSPLDDGQMYDYWKMDEPWNVESPQTCRNFCEYLNAFSYKDCVSQGEETAVGPDEDGDEKPDWAVSYVVCNEWAERYICTDEIVDYGDRQFACDVPHPDLEEWSNARMCEGEQCRCPGPNPDACLRHNEAGNYRSFERSYNGNFTRSSMVNMGVDGDDFSKDLPAACFGFYNEYDPKTRQTQREDRRCVFNVNMENMYGSQQGKGTYKEGNVRDATNEREGGEEDTWYEQLGGAFSFINEKIFKERYQNDLGNVFLAYDELDNGKLKASAQINEQDLFAESNLMRAFDDTGQPRVFTRWWQEQQSRMATLLQPATVRIVLPSTWFLGLDPDDPFLKSVVPSGDVSLPSRADRIELQLEAREDTLGLAMAYLERSVLLRVEEEPIPIVVPMGSPTEFRARAADWCTWYMRTKGEPTCDNAPEEIRTLIERLESYATRIDDYRRLRTELAHTAAAALDVQRKVLEPIAQWFAEHEDDLKSIIEAREQAQEELLPIWQQALQELSELQDRNMPWCMNQRFTAPIYSLLDPWLPSRSQNGAITESDLPTLPTMPRTEDVIIDFSALSTLDGTLKLPVLKPIQVSISIPTPPTAGKLAELPALEPLDEALAKALGNLPTVDSSGLTDPPTLTAPEPISEETLDAAKERLTASLNILRTLRETYANFWMSIGPFTPDGNDQFPRQRELKENLACIDFGILPCAHVEMLLWEVAQRFGSRPLVQLKEDFQSVGTVRSESTVCLPEDDACELLSSERSDPGFQWEIKGDSSNDASLNELRTTIITLTQPPPLGNLDPLLLQPYHDDPSPIQTFTPITLFP